MDPVKSLSIVALFVSVAIFSAEYSYGLTIIQRSSVQQAEAAARYKSEMKKPRPISALDSVWMEELTWMEVRDAMRDGKTTALILTGGVESNGPYLATGKHNYVLRLTGESIARSLGNALIAPIVTLEPGRPDSPFVPPGSVFLSKETYKAVLKDMATSLKSMGFINVVFIGDSGGNQRPMREVSKMLNVEYETDQARFYFVPEYYDYPAIRRFVKSRGIPEEMDPNESRGSDGIHEEYGIDALMMLVDPTTIRLEQRIEADLATINGISLLPMDQTLAIGKEILEIRVKTTVDAIQKVIASAKSE
jgi:creatinine amidohydrolase/Fe(II)-dependent formamide hydrolase-like protein